MGGRREGGVGEWEEEGRDREEGGGKEGWESGRGEGRE